MNSCLLGMLWPELVPPCCIIRGDLWVGTCFKEVFCSCCWEKGFFSSCFHTQLHLKQVKLEHEFDCSSNLFPLPLLVSISAGSVNVSLTWLHLHFSPFSRLPLLFWQGHLFSSGWSAPWTICSVTDECRGPGQPTRMRAGIEHPRAPGHTGSRRMLPAACTVRCF